MEVLLRPVTNRICSMPFASSSSITYSTTGLRATGSISLGCERVAGKSLVPRPATGTTALRIIFLYYLEYTSGYFFPGRRDRRRTAGSLPAFPDGRVQPRANSGVDQGRTGARQRGCGQAFDDPARRRADRSESGGPASAQGRS